VSNTEIPTVIEIADDYATVEVGAFLVTAYDNGRRFNLATVGGTVISTGLGYTEAVAKLFTWIERRDAEGGVLLAQAAVQGDV
jgi:hypothetical protein